MANEKRLIDKDALIKLCDAPHWCVWMSEIEDFPEVDAVEVKHGRWEHPKGYVVSNGFQCSECGHEEASHYPINPRPGGVCIADESGNFFYPPKMNYCPNCGAKMDGDGNS